MTIIQGSNNPLIITFDQSVDNIPILVATLWKRSNKELIKKWEREDMIIEDDVATCPLTEEETAGLRTKIVTLEIKGLDSGDNTVFWESYDIDIMERNDKNIELT